MKEPISKKPSGRPTRKSVGVRDKLLIINKDPDRVYRLVNTDPNRLFEMKQMGYRIEEAAKHIPEGLRTDQALLTDNAVPVGGGQSHVLMSIDKDWYEDAQKEKAEHLESIEAGLKPNSSDGQYGKIAFSSSGKEPT